MNDLTYALQLLLDEMRERAPLSPADIKEETIAFIVRETGFDRAEVEAVYEGIYGVPVGKARVNAQGR
jgi:hypothetical protein